MKLVLDRLVRIGITYEKSTKQSKWMNHCTAWIMCN